MDTTEEVKEPGAMALEEESKTQIGGEEGKGLKDGHGADAVEVKGAEPDPGAKVKRQIEFYFGDPNFRRDKFMQDEAKKDPEGK
jgi:hypothetical protein